jgi:hypothetical protein
LSARDIRQQSKELSDSSKRAECLTEDLTRSYGFVNVGDMTLKQYLRECTTEQRKALWHDNPNRRLYIYAVSSGKRRPGPQAAREIEQLTGGKVTRAELRPDLWGD